VSPEPTAGRCPRNPISSRGTVKVHRALTSVRSAVSTTKATAALAQSAGGGDRRQHQPPPSRTQDHELSPPLVKLGIAVGPFPEAVVSGWHVGCFQYLNDDRRNWVGDWPRCFLNCCANEL
jgi:hypothetical protein